jgi:uncharacterized protein (TIGR03435 family)
MKCALFSLILLLIAATLSRGQSSAFEAASIKINNSGQRGGGISTYPARIKIINAPLKLCVQVAWNVKDFQVSGGASWMETDRYDIDAVAANPFTQDEYRVMLRTLLADRFGMVIHREMHDKPGYALVVAKNGPKLPPSVDDPNVMFSRTSSGDMTLKAPNVTMKRLADALSSTLQAIVVGPNRDRRSIRRFDAVDSRSGQPASFEIRRARPASSF